MWRDPKPWLVGLLTALVCLLFVFGSFALSLAEGTRTVILPSPYPSATAPILLPPPPASVLVTPSPPPSPTLPPPPPSCPSPAGWVPLRIQNGQTIESLARTYNLSVEELMQANCLLTRTLIPGTVLYVPPVATATRQACGVPVGWIPYTVQAGDTLYSLAKYYGVSVAQLQQANCLDSSTLIVIGQIIYVPNMPTRTPVMLMTATMTPSPILPTDTVTPSFTPSPSNTCTDTPIADTPTP